jgi:hypothetical protein
MKKVILLIAGFAIATTASAQLTKGSIWLGTDIGFSSNNSESDLSSGGTTVVNSESSNSSFLIMPNVQYFVVDDLALVLGVGYHTNSSSTDNKSNTTGKTKNSGFSVNVGANKYFGATEKVKPFVGISIGVNPASGTEETTTTTGSGTKVTTKTETETTSFAANLNGGVAFLVTEKLLINTNLSFLGYSSTEFTTTSGNISRTTTSSGINMFLNSNNFLLNVGFAWRLN